MTACPQARLSNNNVALQVVDFITVCDTASESLILQCILWRLDHLSTPEHSPLEHSPEVSAPPQSLLVYGVSRTLYCNPCSVLICHGTIDTT